MVSLVDGALHHLGKPGGFHLLVAVLLCCNFFPITFHHMSMVFYGESIPHTCRLPEGWPWHKKFSIPKASTGIQSKYEACRMFVDPNSAALGTKSCVYGWEFYPQGREWTIIAEWGLVCEREYLVTLAAVVYHGGVMFGGLVFGTLADKFGRKPLMLFTLYAQTAISIGIYFVQNFILFVILRFVHGLLLQGLQCSTICLVMELLPMRYRTAAGMGCSVVWGLGMVSLSLVSYSVQHWRYIQLAISLPCIVTFLYIWLIPESVRWLLTVMKTEKALLTAQKFEQFNKRPLGENFSKDVETATKQVPTNAGQVESYGMRELLLQGSKLRISSLVLCFCWFATSSLYHGLTLMLLEVGSNRYTSMVIIGSVDLVAFIVMYFLLVRFGRKRPICALLVLCGAVCISTVVAENLEIGHTLEVYVVSTVLTLVERSCAAACLAGLTICAAELFPTVIRTFGIGVCLFCGQFGWLMAPQILKLSQFSLKALPWITFGILSLLAGLLVLLLPETLTKPLPDTLEDMENFESRKVAVVSKDKDPAKPPTYGQDWATTYKQKIEEANGTLSTMEAEDHKEILEKRWYTRNYSRRSAKVVRFYGLDSSEDPCQEVKTNKKQRIRMVRFSFESEELPKFRVTSCVPVAVGRFSAIKEEPELETALDEDTAESSLDEDEAIPIRLVDDAYQTNNCVTAETTEILSVLDATDSTYPCPTVVSHSVSDSADQKPRFLVQRVPEPSPQQSCEQDVAGILLTDDHSSGPVENQTRFLVPCDEENLLQQEPHYLHDAGHGNSIEGSCCEAPMLVVSVENRSRILVQKAEELCPSKRVDASTSPTISESDIVGSDARGVVLQTDEPPVVEKKSRFLVQKVEEKPIADECRTNNVVGSVSECGSGDLVRPLMDCKPSRFVVQKVVEEPDMNVLQTAVNGNKSDLETSTIPSSDSKPPRFVVQIVTEEQPLNVCQKTTYSECAAGKPEAPLGNGKPSRFVVEKVIEEQPLNASQKTTDSECGTGKTEAPLGNSKPSRFVVQRVTEKQPLKASQKTADSECATRNTETPLGNSKPSRFVVEKVIEEQPLNASQKITDIECATRNTETPLGNSKPSRFVVEKVIEEQPLNASQKATDSECGTRKTEAPLGNSKPSRFVVQRVTEKQPLNVCQKTTESECAARKLQAPLVNGKPSRFVVQKVPENLMSHRDNVQTSVDANGNVGECDSRTIAASVPLMNGKPSRFVVQKVEESQALCSDGVQNSMNGNSNISECSSGIAAIVPFVNGNSAELFVPKATQHGELHGAQNSQDSNRNIIESSCGAPVVPLQETKPSRFTVRRVSDSKLLQLGSQLIGDCAGRNSTGTIVVNGTKANMAEPKSRFLVQRVNDDVLKVVHLNNNNNISNNNNKKNNDQKLALEKMLEASNAPQGPFNECENTENVQQVALINGNSSAVSVELGNADVLKLHLKHVDIAANS